MIIRVTNTCTKLDKQSRTSHSHHSNFGFVSFFDMTAYIIRAIIDRFAEFRRRNLDPFIPQLRKKSFRLLQKPLPILQGLLDRCLNALWS